MSGYGESLLSKVLDTNDAQAFKRFGVNKDDFATETERQVYEFISEYAETNRGQTPDYRTVVEKHPDFYYREGTTDQYEWLVDNLKQEALLRKFTEFAGEGGMQRIYDEHYKNPREMFERLKSELDNITMGTDVRNKVGTSVKDIDEFKAEYERRKRGESHKTWRSAYSIVNDAGSYTSSNVYVYYGESGRGKSACTIEEAVELGFQGANVLLWSLEMGSYEVLVRLYTLISRRMGVTIAELNGVNMEAGFSSKEIRQGALAEDFEEMFYDFLSQMNDLLPGNITVRAVDDDDFMRRNLAELESNIMQTDADVVIIDPFYYLDYEKNTSKTTGGDAAATSMKLRRLAGRTQTVIIALTQADAKKSEKDEDGVRELRLPERDEVKKTTQLMEDAALLIAVDTNYKEGRGLVGINKGRDGGEDDVCEIVYLPHIGVIKEQEKGEALAEMF